MNKKIILLGLVLVLAVFLSGCNRQVSLNPDVRASEKQFRIENEDDFDWLNVKMELNGSFILKKDTIKAGETIIVDIVDFTKKDGTRFNPLVYKPKEMKISCETPTKGEYGFYSGTWK